MIETWANLLTNQEIIDLMHGNELHKDCRNQNNFDLEAEIQHHIEEELHVEEENQCLVNEQIFIEAENQHHMEQLHQEDIQMQADHWLLLEHEERESQSWTQGENL